jgi:hypothetical protein
MIFTIPPVVFDFTLPIYYGIIALLILSAWVAVYAYKKDRSAEGFFFLSIILSPILAWIIIYALDPNEGTVFKRCDICGEFILTGASVCRHCGKIFNPEYKKEQT